MELDATPGHSQMWLTGRDVLYCFPNDDGVTVAATFLHKDRLPAFKADKEAAFLAAFVDAGSRARPCRRHTRSRR